MNPLLQIGICVSVAALSTLSSAVNAQSLTTTFASNNGRRGNMFDIQTANDLTINSFDVNLVTGLTKEIFIDYKVGT